MLVVVSGGSWSQRVVGSGGMWLVVVADGGCDRWWLVVACGGRWWLVVAGGG